MTAVVEIPEHELRSWDAYLATGSIKAAAHRLGIHETTVKRHLSTIRSRLGVQTNTQAADALARTATNVAVT